MSHRLFIGLRPPELVRDALIDTMEALDEARWQDDEQLHLTLRFVGEVDRPAADDLAAELARIEWPDFPLVIDGVGHFQRSGLATALYAKVRPTALLEGLRHKVERACEVSGLERETRRFTPHVTIARLQRGRGQLADWLARHGRLRAGRWAAGAFTLFESHLSPHGAIYDTVARYPLQA